MGKENEIEEIDYCPKCNSLSYIEVEDARWVCKKCRYQNF